MSADCAVAVVFSNWNINRIFDFLKGYIGATDRDLFYYRIIFKHVEGKALETNKTLFLLNREILDRGIDLNDNVKKEGLDFRIEEYPVDFKDLPLVGHDSNHFISFPKDIPLEEIENIISTRMKLFCSLGLLDRGDYSMTIPLETRFGTKHKGYCKVFYSDAVPFQIRAYIKLILNDSVVLFDKDMKPLMISVKWNKKTN